MSATTSRNGRRHPRGRRTGKQPFEKKYIALLEALRHSDKEQRLALLRKADQKLIKYICECALNVLKGAVSLKSCQKNKLKKHKQVLRKLATKPTGKNSWKKKKRVIVQKGGGFLPLLLAPVLDGIISTIFNR